MMRVMFSVITALLLLFACPLIAASALTIGDQAFDNVGRTVDGNDVAMTDYKGKVVVLSFWASWCAPCRHELPILAGIQRAGKDKVKVIAVNVEDARAFRRAAKILEKVELLLVNDVREHAAKAYGIKAIPEMILVSKDGRIMKMYRGYDEKKLDDIVGEINQALR
jgi:thiol-disulfide isomerase/thioredoxin